MTKTIEEAEQRVEDLKKELDAAFEELNNLTIQSSNREASTQTTSPTESVSPPPGKRGYLYKWQDRQIGWGGTKWSLRFVVLNKGRLAYYRSHTDLSPRYVLELKGCAVRDDLNKTNKHGKLWQILGGVGGEDTFHIFSIYHRPIGEKEEDIIPLLRFSTQSLAEKEMWIDRISQACAYCDSPGYISVEEDFSSSLIQEPATPLPKSKPGTLPPIYFAPPAVSRSYRKKSYKKQSRFQSAYPPSRPMHQASAPSYLSSEASAQSYRGLLNLAFIILIISNFRLMMETIRRHGSVFAQIRLEGFMSEPLQHFPLVTGTVLLHLFILYAYIIEKLLSRKSLNETTGFVLHLLNSNLCLVVSIVIIWCFIPSPVTGSGLLMQAIITWMKLISYAHANSDYRGGVQDSYRATLALVRDLDGCAASVSYPENITLSNLYYFWLAPTLTYQMAYPRSPKVRIPKVLGIIFNLLITLSLLLYLIAQVIVPYIENLIQDLESGTFSLYHAAEYLLKLAIANTYAWLLGFYAFFHLFLNLLAELLRFGDRVFYKDWWNASDVSSYWRLWNMPVHYWLIRHIYFPCIRLGLSKDWAAFAVFFLSAILHEVWISVPFHMVRWWSFIGMLGQVPLVAITKYLDRRNPGGSIGNVIFWLTFCVVGQPMAILLYTIDYWERSAQCEAV